MKKFFLCWLIVLACCKAEMPEPIPEVFAWDTFQVEDSLTVVVIGDSYTQHCPSCSPTACACMFTEQMRVALESKYAYVNFINMGISGTYIQQAMPAWYHLSDYRQSIDSVLKRSPDLIIISYCGNQTVFGQPADSSIYCYNYLVDTLNFLGKAFLLSGQCPRQKTFVPPVTLRSYYDSSKKINARLQIIAPGKWADSYPTMEDTVIKYKMWPYCLGPDSLHLSQIGSNRYFNCHMNTNIMDSIMADFDPRAINFKLTKSGSNVVLDGKYKVREIYVSGSTDNVNWGLLHTFSYPQETVRTVSETFPKSTYTYFKVEVVSGRMRYTVTKHIL